MIIVPCYNEVDRLRIEEFKSHSDKIDFYFADDGSVDNTYSLLEDNGFIVLRSEENIGKGHILYRTYHELKNMVDLDLYEWVGYWDADLTIPLDTIKKILASNLQSTHAVWSSRQRKLALKYDEKLSRRITGRSFAFLIKIFFNIKIHDTQCGAKLFRPTLLPKVFQSPFKSRWLFDIEIYLRLRDNSILEWPLTHWSENGLSRVRLSREVIPVIYDTFRIFWNYRIMKPRYKSTDSNV